MSGASFQDVESFGQLKELYDEDAVYQQNILSSLWNFIDHATQQEVEFDGLNWNVPTTFVLNESYAALNDTERLPDALVQKGVFAKYRVKLMYSGIEMTTFAGTRGHRGGRINGEYLDDTVRGTLMTFTANVDADCYGNGRGYRATTVTATPAASSFTVETSAMLRPGMRLDWYDSTLATHRGSIAISQRGIDSMNRTVYVDAAFGSGAVPAGAGAGDILVVYGALAAGEPTDGRHVQGLQRITDNTVSIGELSSSTWAAWMAVNQNAGNTNPTQQILQNQWDSMYVISQMYPNRVAFNPFWKQSYLNQFLTQRRFTSNIFDTGASSLTFSPVKMGEDDKRKKPSEFKMLEDKNCFPDTVFFWNNSALKFASDYSDTPHLADEDGAEFRIRIGYDSLSGFYRFWGNNVVYQRNAIGSIYNFAVSSNVI